MEDFLVSLETKSFANTNQGMYLLFPITDEYSFVSVADMCEIRSKSLQCCKCNYSLQSGFPMAVDITRLFWFWFQLAYIVKWCSNHSTELETEGIGTYSSRSSQGPVARSMVSANLWLGGIESYTFLWKLTSISANQASSNSSQVYNKTQFNASLA